MLVHARTASGGGALDADRREKARLYARIAASFESLYAESLDEHVERLAHYHAQAGNLPQALEYAGRARGASG